MNWWNGGSCIKSTCTQGFETRGVALRGLWVHIFLIGGRRTDKAQVQQIPGTRTGPRNEIRHRYQGSPFRGSLHLSRTKPGLPYSHTHDTDLTQHFSPTYAGSSLNFISSITHYPPHVASSTPISPSAFISFSTSISTSSKSIPSIALLTLPSNSSISAASIDHFLPNFLTAM